jgi:TrmH RNA methyltransferase
VHHEGVCVLAKAKPELPFRELLARLKRSNGPESIVFLDRVSNPHNLGAIVRVAAHFGTRAILARENLALTPAVYRTAEGGAEAVERVLVDPPARALNALRGAGFTIYGTSGAASRSLYHVRLAKRSVFVFGAESVGLSKELEAACDQCLAIDGTGLVESLNVSCAASVVLSEYWRLSSSALARGPHK